MERGPTKEGTKNEASRSHPMAFTIHFAESKASEGPNRLLANHKRNPSLPNVEQSKVKVAESPLASRRSTNRRAGYHSEGYFSSDQEDDLRVRGDFFVRKLKSLDKGAGNLPQEFERQLVMSGEDEPQFGDSDEASDGAASEAGTYTIEGDAPSPDVALARRQVELAVGDNDDDWVSDWASQVSQHNQNNDKPAGLPPLPVARRAENSREQLGGGVLMTRIPSPVLSPGHLPPSGRKAHPSPQRVRNPHAPLAALNHVGVQEMSWLRGGCRIGDATGAQEATGDGETTSFLRATESLVSAMAARLSLDSESDDASPGDHRGSEGGSPGDTRQAPTMRYNRAFSLRRARLDCDPPVETKRKEVPTVLPNKPRSKPTEPVKGTPARNGTAKSPSSTFARTDCGRFSVRAPKNGPQPTKPPTTREPKKSGRSNSTLSSREVEFQNWKRRKSYDPMKAAAEGKKKDAAAKKATMTSSMTQATLGGDTSPSHQNPVLRSASFHGTGGLSPGRSSEEEATLSADEDSPTHAPAKLLSQLEGAFGAGSRGSSYPAANCSPRRAKMEALDSLMMAATCGLSNKLRGSACSLLRKLRFLYGEDPERADHLSMALELLEGSGEASPQSRSPSRELATTLTNLKRLDTVFKVLDEVLFDEEDLELELEEY